MITDLTDMDSTIRGYMVSVISEHFPELDISEKSVFDDMFIKPMIEILRPFIDRCNRLELKSNLSNAEFMTEEELDDEGEGNYFISRRAGQKASTTVTISFANVNLNNPELVVKIPAGVIFATASGMEFQTDQDVVLNAEDMSKAYNKQRMTYEIDVPVHALGIGTEYNVTAGEIIMCNNLFSSYYIGVVNKSDVVNGKDKESNLAYARRIKEHFVSRQLGTEPGYKAFIVEAFDEVIDVYVAGFRNKYMKRDLLKVYIEETKEIIEKHIGGMVDIYIRGSVYESTQSLMTLNSNFVLLNVSMNDLIYEESAPSQYVRVYNLTDSSKIPVVKSVTSIPDDFMKGKHAGQVKMVLDNENNKSFDPDIVSDMKVVYDFVEGEETITTEQYFQIGIAQADMATPIKSIGSLELVGQDELIQDTDKRIKITREGEAATSNEVASVRVIDCDDYPNGYELALNYTINETIRSIGLSLQEVENRIITTDVLIREAEAVPVNIQFRVKLTDKYKLSDAESIISRIKSSVSSFFDGYVLGDSIEQSDIVGWLYTDKAVSDIIQYIELPFKVFYVPNDVTEDIPTDGTQVDPDGVLNIEEIQYPIINAAKFVIELIP